MAAVMLLVSAACARDAPPPPANRPDSLLRTELGLTDRDEVHRVTLTGGTAEVLDPVETTLTGGAWVEFVTTDGRVHEVHFEADSLKGDALAFMKGTDQMSSPPLVNKGERFVVSFRNAPAGRYPFRVEGNEDPAHGVVVVKPNS